MKSLGAHDKLHKYFLDHLGEVLDSDILREIAGISEWAWCVRELSNEEGYQILTHHVALFLNPVNIFLKTRNYNQHLYGKSVKKPLLMCLSVMDLPARCAVLLRVNFIHMAQRERPCYISDI